MFALQFEVKTFTDVPNGLLFAKQKQETDKNNTKYTRCTQIKAKLKFIWSIISHVDVFLVSAFFHLYLLLSA